MFSHLLLFDFQEGSQLSLAVVVSLSWIEGDDVVGLGFLEKFLLFFVLEIFRKHHHAFSSHTAFHRVALLVNLHNSALYHVVVLVGIHFLVVSATLPVHLHLSVNHLILYFNLEVWEFIFGRQLHLNFRCDGDIESESEGISIDKFNLVITFSRHQFAKHIDFVLTDIFVEFALKELVHFLSEDGCAILLSDESFRHHSLSESRHVGVLSELLDSFLNILLIVGRFHHGRNHSVEFVGRLQCNVHLRLTFFY